MLIESISAQPGSAALDARVTNNSERAIKDAKVAIVVNGKEVFIGKTDRKGYVHIGTNIDLGKYLIRVSAKGFVSFEKEVFLTYSPNSYASMLKVKLLKPSRSKK